MRSTIALIGLVLAIMIPSISAEDEFLNHTLTDTIGPSYQRSDSSLDLDARSCEVLAASSDRIACRLAEGTSDTVVPEACKGLSEASGQSECIRTFAAAYPCAEEIPTKKDQCYKKAAGFIRIEAADQAKIIGSEEILETYAIFMLYDFQKNVEKLYSQGRISMEAAVGIITQTTIVEQAVVMDYPKETLLEEFSALKQIWQEQQQ